MVRLTTDLSNSGRRGPGSLFLLRRRCSMSALGYCVNDATRGPTSGNSGRGMDVFRLF